MKKLKKILAVLSATVLTGTMAATQVFADDAEILYSFSEHSPTDDYDVVYDKITTTETGKKYLERISDTITVNGIVVTMPDENAPTAEKLGFDFEVSDWYHPDDTVKHICPPILWDNVKNNVAPFIAEDFDNAVIPEFKETTFRLYNCYDPETGEKITTEEEYTELAEKLVVRGLVEDATLSYVCLKTDCHFEYTSENESKVHIRFNGNEHAENFSFEKYSEIKEMMKYSEYDFEVYETSDEKSIVLYGNLTDSTYTDYISHYNDLIALRNKLLENHEEISTVDMAYIHDFSGASGFGLAENSIQPTWGDATNDDMIDIYDAVEIAKHVMNLNELDEDTVLLADINCDGETNLYDAIEISKTLMA